MAKRRTRVWKKKAKAAQLNNKLWAEGAREDLMRPHVEAYADALQRGWRVERNYLQKVCNEYHFCISWRLGDNEEPSLPLPTYNAFAPPVTETLTDEEKEAKQERIQSLNVVRDVTLVTCRAVSPPTNVANPSLAQVPGAFAAARIRQQDRPSRKSLRCSLGQTLGRDSSSQGSASLSAVHAGVVRRPYRAGGEGALGPGDS
jgi:hypothetical protein